MNDPLISYYFIDLLYLYSKLNPERALFLFASIMLFIFGFAYFDLQKMKYGILIRYIFMKYFQNLLFENSFLYINNIPQ